MDVFAVLLVITAGAMWAGCGLAAQDFFSRSSLTPMDLTVFRMFCAGVIMMALTIARGNFVKSIRILKDHPFLLAKLSFYGIIGLMLMHWTYFASIEAGNAAAATMIQYTCPAIVILWTSFRKGRLPGTAEAASVILAIGGVFLLVTGGNLDRIMVPADCIWLGLASAVFFAVCAVYPKNLMAFPDASFVLSIGMFCGAAAAFAADPVTDIGAFFHRDIIMDIFWIVICGTVVAFTCYNTGLRRLTETEASVTATVEPAISVIASYFLFSEMFNVFQAVGIILILAAIAAPGSEHMLKKRLGFQHK